MTGIRNTRIPIMLDSSKLDILADEIEKAGRLAERMQKDVHRSFKTDGSVLTEADTMISRLITGKIHELFPEAAIISEEEAVSSSRDAEWVFILDPIDGTDVYSQGLPTFAVSLGVLDKDRNPVGAYISAPRFGLGGGAMNIRMDPGKAPLMNGEIINVHGNKDEIHQITIGSKGPKEFDFSSFNGKIRVLGSTIIHILSVAVIPTIEGTVVQKCYAWDIASSHAVLKSVGMDLEDENGKPFTYDDNFLFGKKQLTKYLYGGSEAGRKKLRAMLPPL